MEPVISGAGYDDVSLSRTYNDFSTGATTSAVIADSTRDRADDKSSNLFQTVNATSREMKTLGLNAVDTATMSDAEKILWDSRSLHGVNKARMTDKERMTEKEKFCNLEQYQDLKKHCDDRMQEFEKKQEKQILALQLKQSKQIMELEKKHKIQIQAVTDEVQELKAELIFLRQKVTEKELNVSSVTPKTKATRGQKRNQPQSTITDIVEVQLQPSVVTKRRQVQPRKLKPSEASVPVFSHPSVDSQKEKAPAEIFRRPVRSAASNLPISAVGPAITIISADAPMCLPRIEPATAAQTPFTRGGRLRKIMDLDGQTSQVNKKTPGEKTMQLRKVPRTKSRIQPERKNKTTKKPVIWKQFSCDVCGRRFVTIKGKLHHRQSVHDGKRWNCRYCGKAYMSPSGCNRHENEAHGGHCYRSITRCGQEERILNFSDNRKANIANRATSIRTCHMCHKKFCVKTSKSGNMRCFTCIAEGLVSSKVPATQK